MLKSPLKEIIKHMDKQIIKTIAKNTAEERTKEIAFPMTGKYDIEEWISILKDRTRSPGFSIKDYSDKDDKSLVIYHEMGETWSIFFETYYYTIFYELGSNIKSDHTENSILLEIKKSV